MINGSRQLISCLIVDDEQEARDILTALLEPMSNIRMIGAAASVEEAYKMALTEVPDLIFLDVNMPGADGFELVRKFQSMGIECGYVFVTAYQEHAIRAIKVSALDYLLKPIDRTELAEAVMKFRVDREKSNLSQKLNVLLDESGANKIRINTRTGYKLIDPTRITHCEADGNYTNIYLKDGQKEVSSIHLGKIEEMMPDSMVRISRYHLVNRNCIADVQTKKKKLILESDNGPIELSIPFRKVREVKERLG